MTNELYKENEEKAGLYDVCEWIVEIYPDDIFKGKEHPVIKMRELAKEILKKKPTNKE